MSISQEVNRWLQHSSLLAENVDSHTLKRWTKKSENKWVELFEGLQRLSMQVIIICITVYCTSDIAYNKKEGKKNNNYEK